MVSLTNELSQKNEELLRHQEEIALLLSQIVELQHRVKEVRQLNCGYKQPLIIYTVTKLNLGLSAILLLLLLLCAPVYFNGSLRNNIDTTYKTIFLLGRPVSLSPKVTS